MDTNTQEYADYLIDRQKSLRSIVFQLPYRSHLKILNLGRTLDIGCGAGRNLAACSPESVGTDHNVRLVSACKAQGLTAFTTDEWESKGNTEYGTFDSLLISHVAEHIPFEPFVELLKKFSNYLKPGGRIVIICPQELGYASDSTHVEFMDFDKIKNAILAAGMGSASPFKINRSYSFPFPRFMGKLFPFNEFVVIATKSEVR